MNMRLLSTGLALLAVSAFSAVRPTASAAQAPVLDQAVVSVEDDIVLRVDDPEVVGCLWMSTYNLHGSPGVFGESIGSVRLSFYVRGEPRAGVLATLDGSDARFHTRVRIGANPVMFSRKGVGFQAEFEETAALSDLGELVLSSLSIPTRAGPDGPTVRAFSSEEHESIRQRFGEAFQCVGHAEGYDRRSR
jgi:hypothetical protein